MSTIHEKLYAALVSKVDEAITVLERTIENQDFNWFQVLKVTNMLRTALLETEETYIEADKSDAPFILDLPLDAQTSTYPGPARPGPAPTFCTNKK